jgi:hypothetical protein
VQVDAAPVERGERVAGVRIQRQRAVERRLQFGPSRLDAASVIAAF